MSPQRMIPITPKSVANTGSSTLSPYCEMRYLPTTFPLRSHRNAHDARPRFL